MEPSAISKQPSAKALFVSSSQWDGHPLGHPRGALWSGSAEALALPAAGRGRPAVVAPERAMFNSLAVAVRSERQGLSEPGPGGAKVKMSPLGKKSSSSQPEGWMDGTKGAVSVRAGFRVYWPVARIFAAAAQFWTTLK